MQLDKKAVFSLSRFKFKKFSFDDTVIDIEKGEAKFHLNTSGVFKAADSEYILEFDFITSDPEYPDKPIIKITLEAIFVFSDNVKSIEEIPDYFFSNAIAILYPYLRSFISSMTVQANDQPIILPAMNLSKLGDSLRDRTRVE